MKNPKVKKLIKYAVIGLVAVFIIIQLIPVNRTNPPVVPELELQAPPEVTQILQTSCYDCHSHHTTWPAYSYVAPVSWLVAHDVDEGRDELNFSEWNSLSPEKQQEMKEEIWEAVSEGEMPMPIYLITHGNAKLTNQQKDTLKNWATN